MLSLLLLFTLICASSSFAFLPSSTCHRSLSPLLAVVDISDEATFDSAISGANSLVIVDYSTTWCGPCKVIAPKFEELSEQVRYTHSQMPKYGHIYTQEHTFSLQLHPRWRCCTKRFSIYMSSLLAHSLKTPILPQIQTVYVT
jgi:hypothetical protein